MGPLALKALNALRSLPLNIQIAIATAVALVTLGGSLVLFGEHRAEVKVERQARTDSTKAAAVALDTARRHEVEQLEHVIATATATASAAITRTRARDAVTIVDSQTVTIGLKVDTVPTAIVALIKADDAKIAADSIHAAAVDSLLPALTTLEAAHAAVDAAMSHQITAGDGDAHDASHIPLVVAVLAIGEGLRIAYNFLHHAPLFP